MKKIFLLLSVLVSLFCMDIGAQEPQNEAKASLTFDFISYDFGEFRFKKDSKSVQIPYKNTGNAPLVIIRTEQTCSCLSVQFSKKPLKPGETGILTITYSPTKTTGKFEQFVIIHSNSDTPRQRIRVSGNVLNK